MKKYRGYMSSGILIKTSSCIHYEAAIIKAGEIISPAKSYVTKNNKYICEVCGYFVGEKNSKKLDELVKSLNELEEDDKVLAKLYKGIEIYEATSSVVGQKFENASVCDGVPMKNETID